TSPGGNSSGRPPTGLGNDGLGGNSLQQPVPPASSSSGVVSLFPPGPVSRAEFLAPAKPKPKPAAPTGGAAAPKPAPVASGSATPVAASAAQVAASASASPPTVLPAATVPAQPAVPVEPSAANLQSPTTVADPEAQAGQATPEADPASAAPSGASSSPVEGGGADDASALAAHETTSSDSNQSARQTPEGSEHEGAQTDEASRQAQQENSPAAASSAPQLEEQQRELSSRTETQAGGGSSEQSSSTGDTIGLASAGADPSAAGCTTGSSVSDPGPSASASNLSHDGGVDQLARVPASDTVNGDQNPREQRQGPEGSLSSASASTTSPPRPPQDGGSSDGAVPAAQEGTGVGASGSASQIGLSESVFRGEQSATPRSRSLSPPGSISRRSFRTASPERRGDTGSGGVPSDVTAGGAAGAAAPTGGNPPQPGAAARDGGSGAKATFERTGTPNPGSTASGGGSSSASSSSIVTIPGAATVSGSPAIRPPPTRLAELQVASLEERQTETVSCEDLFVEFLEEKLQTVENGAMAGYKPKDFWNATVDQGQDLLGTTNETLANILPPLGALDGHTWKILTIMALMPYCYADIATVRIMYGRLLKPAMQ
ncbi:unnamed protein product, partial [Amoebophrya sp. A120]